MSTHTPILTRSPCRLAQAKRAVLQHVECYGLTVPAAAQHLKPLKTLPEREARRVLTDLEREGRLRHFPLFAGKHCHVLAPSQQSLAVTAGALSRKHKPLSEETKLRRYAMLSFCCLSSVPRQRLSRQEVAKWIGRETCEGLTDSYYRHKGRLGFLRVDMTGRGRWDRVVARIQSDAWKHARDANWKPLISTDQLEITLVTTLPQKADRLCRAIGELAVPPPVPVRVVAIPDLLYFIAPPRDC